MMNYVKMYSVSTKSAWQDGVDVIDSLLESGSATDASMTPEVAYRVGQTWAAFRPLRKNIFAHLELCNNNMENQYIGRGNWTLIIHIKLCTGIH